jgi:hypothetical protein
MVVVWHWVQSCNSRELTQLPLAVVAQQARKGQIASLQQSHRMVAGAAATIRLALVLLVAVVAAGLVDKTLLVAAQVEMLATAVVQVLQTSTTLHRVAVVVQVGTVLLLLLLTQQVTVVRVWRTALLVLALLVVAVAAAVAIQEAESVALAAAAMAVALGVLELRILAVVAAAAVMTALVLVLVAKVLLLSVI